MKTKSLLKAGVFCTAMIGCVDLSAGLQAPDFGVSAAEARSYYTRKKIDGRWVTGIFPKKGRSLPAEARASEPPAETVAQPAPPPQPTLLGLNIPGVDLTYRPPMSAQVQQAAAPAAAPVAVPSGTVETAAYTGTRTAPAGRTIAGTPGVQDAADAELGRDQRRVRTAARETKSRRETVAEAKARSSSERKRAEEEFARATAQPDRQEPAALPQSVQAYAPTSNDLFTALQRKARAMAEEEATAATGALAPVRSVTAEPSRPRANPVRAAMRPVKAVTLDYENGIRTTIFQDGTIEEEPIGTGH